MGKPFPKGVLHLVQLSVDCPTGLSVFSHAVHPGTGKGQDRRITSYSACFSIPLPVQRVHPGGSTIDAPLPFQPLPPQLRFLLVGRVFPNLTHRHRPLRQLYRAYPLRSTMPSGRAARFANSLKGKRSSQNRSRDPRPSASREEKGQERGAQKARQIPARERVANCGPAPRRPRIPFPASVLPAPFLSARASTRGVCAPRGFRA